MAPALQAKLLRVLQEKEVHPVGAAMPVPTDVRIVTATHRDLATMTSEGRFRDDLMYRINVIEVVVPPLRERPDDLEPLVGYLLARHGARLGKSECSVSSDVMAVLRRHTWPGNVRELGHTMERLAVFALQATRVEDLDWLAFAEECPEALATLLQATADEARGPVALGARGERARRAIEREGGSATKAAQRLGISRTTLWRWLQQPA
jgi:transcriptional regulator, propionate catabolism operon regulatory protein